MKRILGLDLGTTSIGWAVVNQSEHEGEKSQIIKLGVRVNPLTTDEKQNFESGKSITTTSDRTLKRGMRRNLQRYKARRDNLVAALKRHGLITDSTPLCETGYRSTHETLRLRAKAANEEVSLEELARVLISINKKRGYKSNRKANDDESGVLIDGMAIARELYDNGLTPGQWSHKHLSAGGKFVPSFYRSDLIAEFDALWSTQSAFYPYVFTPALRDALTEKGKLETIRLFKKEAGIEPEEEKNRKKRRNVYYRWRSEGVSQRLDLGKAVTVFAEIQGDIKGSSGYLGAISDHSKELLIKGITVGQFLWQKIQDDPHCSLKNIVFYRLDYLNEFERIWETQAKYHNCLTGELKSLLRDIIIFYQRKLKSKKFLIARCELEGKEIRIGEKTCVTGPRVCPISSPAFQEFRLLQSINSLRVSEKYVPGRSRMTDIQPTTEQREALFRELNCCEAMKAAAMLKIMGLSDKTHSINFKEIKGNKTMSAILASCKRILELTGHDVQDFDKMDAHGKLSFVENVFEQVLGARTDFLTFAECTDADEMQHDKLFKLWHLLYSFEDDNSATGNAKLVEHVSELTGLPHDMAAVMAATKFEQDYSSLSTKAILKLLPFMRRDGMLYSEACEAAGYRHSKSSLTKEENEQRTLKDAIEVLPKNSLRNPVVEKILNQMIHVVNNCTAAYGPFDEIHIEMARNLKQTKQQREIATKRLAERTKDTERIKKILKEEFGFTHIGRNDIIRYELYEELAPNGYHTLYSGTYIPKEKLFTPNFDIEHIIPQARLFDDSFVNKTLEARAVNIAKSDMTAIDYVQSTGGDAAVEEYVKRIAFLQKVSPQKHKRLMWKSEDVPSDFLNRDLTDSQYIAKKAAEMLRQVTRRTLTTTGSITARLRNDWQLVDVMKELNWDKFTEIGLTRKERNRDGHEIKIIDDWSKRNDNRHHAMDALTIAFTQQRHILYLNTLNSRYADDKQSLDEAQLVDKQGLIENGKFLPPMPLGELREQAMTHLSEVLVSIKAKNKVATVNLNKTRQKAGMNVQKTFTPRGQLHLETVYGQRQRYATKLEKVGSSFDEAKIATVCSKRCREALLKRLHDFGDNPKKAFTGKNSLEKNPIWLNAAHSQCVPPKVKTVELEIFYTIRKPITPDLKLDKVVDKNVRQILERRLEQFGGNPREAFSNLEENPIWLNKEKGIAIKRVTITGITKATPLRLKHDNHGNLIPDIEGNPQPVDFVNTGNNHHVAIFEDQEGKWQEHVVPLFEAIQRKNMGLPVVDKEYNAELGWNFLFTMKQNEMFVVPDEQAGFDPLSINLCDPQNFSIISKHLFRVQKITKSDYTFRHHLETNVQDDNRLKNITWIRIKSPNNLKGYVKVRIDHLGRIVDTGEY